MPSEIKQVIVVRKDLNMRRGKEIAQGSHASIAFLTKRLKQRFLHLSQGARPLLHQNFEMLSIKVLLPEVEWFCKHFTKVCVRVSSEQELRDIHAKALAAGLESHLIEDDGTTEFHGVKTATCCAIGPDFSEKIDPITGHLELY